MVTIYKDTRTDKLYALDEQITMGDKLCMIPFDKGEDKFLSPSTLKRWFTKWEEVDVLVEVKAFTGMKIGLFKVVDSNKDDYSVWAKNGTLMTFNRSHELPFEDKQINAKNPKFANRIGRTIGWFTPTWLS